VKYWIHNNLVTVSGKKMSKSLGNFVTLKDAFIKYDPIVVRFFILQSHYRSTLDFSDEALQGAKTGYEKLLTTIRNLREELQKAKSETRKEGISFDLSLYKKRFMEAMDDDFNAPLAMGVLFEMSRETNQALNSDQKLSLDILKKLNACFSELGGKILGIIPDQVATKKDGENIESQLMDIHIKVRLQAKQEKAWWAADLIRKELEALGIRLEDKRDGTNWSRSN
jgi:cysteinyl-tRNA synthetase